MIADTCFIIDLLENDSNAIAKLEDLEKKGEHQDITALTVFELFSGIAQSSRPQEEREKVMSILNNQTIVNFDRASAEKAGEIDGTLAKQGNRIEIIDSMLAGIALKNQERVITRNVKHFSRIKGLEIEEY